MITGQDQQHPPLSLREHDTEYILDFTYLSSSISSTGDVGEGRTNENQKGCGSVPVAPQQMVVQCHQHGHQTTPLQVRDHPNSDLRLRDVDEDGQ